MKELSYADGSAGVSKCRDFHDGHHAVQFEEEAHREEAPRLLLGLIGFSSEQHEAVARLLGALGEWPVSWRTGSLPEADAWIVNGARTQVLGDGSLRVGLGEAGPRSVRLALDEVDRPIAFAEPLASREFEPALSFRMDDAGLASMLEGFQTAWLARKAASLWLGARLVATRHTLTHRVYHLMHGSRLIATIDRIGDVGLMPGLNLAAIQHASWEGRPSSASYIPSAFERTTISELVWTYALRADADLLPARYRSARIYFRRPPKVPQRLIGDDCLLVMQELVVRAAGFVELQARTGLGPVLARTLAALHLAGSVTTNPQRAHAAPVGPLSLDGGSHDESMWSHTRGRSVFGFYAPSFGAHFTAPARLPSGLGTGTP